MVFYQNTAGGRARLNCTPHNWTCGSSAACSTCRRQVAGALHKMRETRETLPGPGQSRNIKRFSAGKALIPTFTMELITPV